MCGIIGFIDRTKSRMDGSSIKAALSLMGLFCTESFDYEKLIAGKLKSEYALEPMRKKLAVV